MAIINGIMETFIMDNGNSAKCMELESFIGKMDTTIRDSISMILSMAKAKWSGILITGTGAIGPMAKSMVMVNK